MICTGFRVELNSFTCLHVKQRRTKEAVTAHKLPIGRAQTSTLFPASRHGSIPQQCHYPSPGLVGNIHIPQNVFRVHFSKSVQAAEAVGTGTVLNTVILIHTVVLIPE